MYVTRNASLATLAAFVAMRLGWPWPILILPACVVAVALMIPSPSQQINRSAFPITRSLLLSFAVFLIFALLIGWLTAEILFDFGSNMTESVTGYRLYDFLLGTPLLKVFWAIVVSVALAPLFSLFVLLPYSGAGTRGPATDVTDPHNRPKSLFSDVLAGMGASQGTLIVQAGKTQVVEDPAGRLQTVGGPGVLSVQEGHAVILERGGQLSRVVGRGRTWLQPFERVSMIIPLYSRAEHIIAEDIATSDRVLIKEFEFWVFYKVDAGPEKQRIQDGQFSYNIQILLGKVWSNSGNDWWNGVKNVGETAARDVIGRFALEQIVPMADEVRTEFKDMLKAQMNQVTQKVMGVEVTAIEIGKVTIPAKVEERLLERWAAGVDEGTRIIRAETDKSVQATQAWARMQNI